MTVGSRLIVFVGLAGSALALTACTTKYTTAPPATVVRVAHPTTTAQATKASSVPLHFPGTQPYVRLVGYDEGRDMVEFRVLTRHPRDGVQDEYDYDTGDPAIHRLPLATAVSIDGLPDGASGICPAVPGGHCTTAQLAEALRGQPAAPVIAQLVVDDTDHVTEVAEQLGALL